MNELVGILINRKDSLNIPNHVTNKKIELIIDANKEVQIDLVFFSLIDVDLKAKKIDGFYFNEDKQILKKGRFPYPGVIYKQGSILTKEKNRLKAFLRDINTNGIRIVNPIQNFDKWEVYDCLRKNKKIKHKLPETVLYKSHKELDMMFARYDSVYIKPTGGRRGKNIIRVDKDKNGYKCVLFRNAPKIITVKNKDELIYYVNKLLQNETIIIQKTIDLITLDNKLVDLRVEAQRDGADRIIISAIPVRLGKESAPITQHAQSYPFEMFFKSYIGLSDLEISRLYVDIEKISASIYKTLESDYGKCGEMGIDLGVDKRFNIKIIESNSRPTKVSLLKAYGEKTLKDFYKNLLRYSVLLTK